MSNLKHNNFHDYWLVVNRDEFWDLYLNKDIDFAVETPNSEGFYDRCLISYISADKKECIGEDGWIYSSPAYSWGKGVAIGQTLYDISYTGVDNGLFTFRKDRISNKEFVDLFQSNTYRIDEGDTRLKLHAVSGSTQQFEYPLSVTNEGIKLNGGFYQGFFKTECDKYQVLPSYFSGGSVYQLEMTLRKCDLEKESDKTLNDKYPENKGIFFYIGTRSENKWAYLYDKDDIDGLEECLQLGMGDFVEGGDIDKKDYIIGNFYDLDVDFDFYDPFELGDYTNYKYYDEDLYDYDECDWNNMYDYLDIEDERKPRIIDENANHITLEFCGCSEEAERPYKLVPFFNACACPRGYRKVPTSKPTKESGLWYVFGDNYIGDFEGLDYDTDYLEPELDISDFEYETHNGFKMSESGQYYFYTDNKFMMFDRTKDGYTTKNWIEGTQYMYYGRKRKFKGNLFILMNRTKTGYTVNNIDELIDKESEPYNPYNALYNNALAFRITDDGAIGYRYLTVDCEKEGRNKTAIEEGYSFDGVIPDCEWFTLNIRISFSEKNMMFMFYVNGKLVYITKELPKLDLRELDDLSEKQEGVPYNISLGGGTQGLAETIQYNYMLNPTRVYPLEKYFAGSFIGYMKSFRLYECEMQPLEMLHNYRWEVMNPGV
jgi:hypothetical protein